MVISDLSILYHTGYYDSVYVFNDELSAGFTLAFCKGQKYEYVETHRGKTKVYMSFNALDSDYHKITNSHLKQLRILR